jgi:TfoX/Sxy family transcriptional regulator of competence genes
MVDSYLQALRSILALSEAEQRSSTAIECKHFFSGAAAYVDGRIFMSLTPAGLALKLAAADRDALLAQGATALRYFPKAPVKKDYAVLPDSIRSDEAVLARWIAASIEHCKALP